ncbi:MAG: MarR family winged helix-turn-helix transcriptional regulator [Bacilli bacterium]|jgi:transcriptional regulator, MarR family|nr:MarR family transcriptional regulator [Staphylococcus sp.]
MELYNNLKNELIEALLQLYISNQASSIAEMLEGEHAVLSYILKEEQDVTPTNISIKLGITKSRVTAILNSLHEKELVLLKRKSDDRRKIIVSLTEKGEEDIVSKLVLLDNKIVKLIKELGIEKSTTLIGILNDINQIIIKEKINER